MVVSSIQVGTRAERPVATAEDLQVTFTRRGREVHALRGLNLELQEGEIFGLVGESGSGKSALAHTLLGLHPLNRPPRISGEVRVCGIDMLRSSKKDLRVLRSQSLGAIFQDPMTSLNPTMRIGKQVRETCRSLDETLRVLKEAEIPEPAQRLKSFPHELSGGLRQRVMIAMAVAGDRRLIIADEPTTALDVTIQAEILKLLRNICDQTGTTFLFITHDLAVASILADRIGVLYAGQMMELGQTTEVLRQSHHPYTSGLLASRLDMSTPRYNKIETIRGSPQDATESPSGCAFAPRCPHRISECEQPIRQLTKADYDAGQASQCIRASDLVRLGELQVAGDQPPKPAGSAAAQGNQQVVELIDVRKTFVVRAAGGRRHLQALRGITLTVGVSESVALVGESGCGKSTLLRLIGGLQRPDSGRVVLADGAHTQMVFQEAGGSLTPWLTVGELIVDRLRRSHHSRAEERAKVAEALHRVGLSPEVAGLKVRQLSGGQQQRVAIARAIVVPPQLLLCDEPTSALDVSLTGTVLNLLHDLRLDLGMALLFVTHDLAVARHIADRIIVMYLGEIVEEATAEELTAEPHHPYSAALIAAVPSQKSSVQVRGDTADPLSPPIGCTFNPRCPEASDICRTNAPPLVWNSTRTRRLSCHMHEP
jgi:peptide/nickel transport system ATP-binding protein